jgi:hypothetical protein
MTKLAEQVGRKKHWQVFVVIGLPFIAAQYYMHSSLGADFDMARFDEVFTRGMLINIPIFSLFLIWLWSITAVANSRIPIDIRPALKLYNFMLPYVVAYFLFATFFFPRPSNMQEPVVPIWLIFPLHLVATFGLFYALIFCAKNLVMAERQKRVSFGNYVLTLFLVWFYPIGVWFIQPRLNSIAIATTSDEEQPGITST